MQRANAHDRNLVIPLILATVFIILGLTANREAEPADMGGTGELPETESTRTDSAISSISVATGLDFGFSGL